MANTLSKIHIQVDLDAFAESSPEVGVVYFDFRDSQFPSLGWSDFIIIIISWWLNSLFKMIAKNLDIAELRFMDGPHLIRINRITESEVECVCINEKSDLGSIDLVKEETEFVRNVDFSVLCSELLKTAQNIVCACEERNYISKDLDKLKESINSFKDITTH
ncbi:MAG: hypothetical protein KA099_07925 [Alphaproteobacteria bacterium]|nr:hypothetical protein [Alphaproteobacteria bacterium]MBP7760025.1 hypothetical protein [Alphaproteobacteria bacterium]MBP7763213.1 hypothetical protein [Alphaproteobacteria bacterium]MBP7905237.1 hypothetical protein [Alphaproteobacteria bacterium]